jgi:hypothetical protein
MAPARTLTLPTCLLPASHPLLMQTRLQSRLCASLLCAVGKASPSPSAWHGYPCPCLSQPPAVYPHVSSKCVTHTAHQTHCTATSGCFRSSKSLSLPCPRLPCAIPPITTHKPHLWVGSPRPHAAARTASPVGCPAPQAPAAAAGPARGHQQRRGPVALVGPLWWWWGGGGGWVLTQQ